ncbi:hypothetical protein GCM10010844_24850 [Deinococcus radiotolerans]|uniref:Uncharacterized protein n=1 Tax=Deinococcus radiotolerans TaxID=1309407 RepID=A0ABQ2FJV7_9DEIO|nr:hypothetical protein GCM10010844_24850 [Deinococcus radiotolerans]
MGLTGLGVATGVFAEGAPQAVRASRAVSSVADSRFVTGASPEGEVGTPVPQVQVWRGEGVVSCMGGG